MKTRWWFVLSLAACLSPGFVDASAHAQDFNDVGTVSGHVEIQNHPSLGVAPCRHCEFLIQRTGCRRCLIYVRTDENGDYALRIGIGRWRVLMPDRAEGASRNIDLLDSHQPREFEIRSPIQNLTFNVSVNLTSEAQ